MIRNVIENLGGVGIYGIISVCFFFTCFTGLLFWVFRLKKSYLNSMRELPLDDSSVRSLKNEFTSEPDSRHE